MATAKRRGGKALKLVRDSASAAAEMPARKETRKILPGGNHVAPFRSRAGNPMIVVIWRGDHGNQLFALGEVTEMRGAEYWLTPAGRSFDDHWKYIPRDEHLLPRGVHRAPWRIVAGRDAMFETFLAIDSEHRLVEMLNVRRLEDGSPDDEGEAEAQRFLVALLDSRDATLAEEEAARDPADPAPVPDSWGFCRISRKMPRRGIWHRHNSEYYFVDSDKRHIATLEFHNHYEREASPFDLTRTMRRLMAWLDPQGEDDDDDDDLAGDEWKRG